MNVQGIRQRYENLSSDTGKNDLKSFSNRKVSVLEKIQIYEQLEELESCIEEKSACSSKNGIPKSTSQRHSYIQPETNGYTSFHSSEKPPLPEKTRNGINHERKDTVTGRITQDESESISSEEGSPVNERDSPVPPPRRKKQVGRKEQNMDDLLASPLPKGPPPQKPPRTFAYDASKESNSAVRMRLTHRLSSDEKKRRRNCLSKPPVSKAKPTIVARGASFSNETDRHSVTTNQLLHRPLKPYSSVPLQYEANTQPLQRKATESSEKCDTGYVPDLVNKYDKSPDNTTVSVSANCDVVDRNSKGHRKSASSEVSNLHKVHSGVFLSSLSEKLLRPPNPPPSPPPYRRNVVSDPSPGYPISPYAVSKSSLSSMCCGLGANVVNYDRLPSINSRMFVDLTPTTVGRPKNYRTLRRSYSDDHIYSEPEELVVKSSPEYAVPHEVMKGIKESRKEEDGLHYMSTPVPKPVNKSGRIYNKSPGSCQQLRKKMAKQNNNGNQLNKVLEEALGIMDSLSIENATNRSSYLEDGDAEKLTEERKQYVRSVSRRFSEVLRKNLTIQPRNLFECLLVVGLENNTPYLKSVYPPDADFPESLPHFCFPDAQLCPRVDGCLSYSIVITNEKGDRKFGYCRRIVPKGSSPIAYCLISTVRAHGFYGKILTELERIHGCREEEMKETLSSLHCHTMPSPGKAIHLLHNSKTILNIKRPSDSRLEDVEVSILTDSMDIPTFIKVFGTVLLERRLFFTSKSISKLSVCVSALDSLLYPFSWQHILIPVIPTNLMDVCSAPTPFILGVMHPDLVLMKDREVEEDILMVDLDSGRVLKSTGDESTILPRKLQQALSCMLELVYKVTKSGEPSRSLLISEFFITFYVELIGHYNQFIITNGANKHFQRERFVKGAGSKSIQQFLDWFSETAMFTMFIEGKLKGHMKHEGLFERRVWEHSGNNSESHKSQTIMKNAQEFSKKLKSWGGKMKDWRASQ